MSARSHSNERRAVIKEDNRSFKKKTRAILHPFTMIFYFNLAFFIIPLAVDAYTSNYDVAAGSVVTASSISSTRLCEQTFCGPEQVFTQNNTSQWASSDGSCSPTRKEWLLFDWSSKYATQFISEIRFRYSALAGEYKIQKF
jgi:hypothetical protein